MSKTFKNRIQNALGFGLGIDFADDYLVTQVTDCVSALDIAVKDIDYWRKKAEFQPTLRERFAGQAMQGILANHNCTNDEWSEWIPGDAVELADALIAELERTK
jgi:hypothetical protein